MRRFLFSVLLIIGSFVLQTTLFQALSFGGIVPNLMIVLTASYGFMRGKKAGLLTGFFSGLLCDIFFGSVIGLNALIYMYIGYLNGQFHHVFYPDDIKLPLISIFVSDLSYGILYYLTLFMLRGRFHFSYYGTYYRSGDGLHAPCNPVVLSVYSVDEQPDGGRRAKE